MADYDDWGDMLPDDLLAPTKAFAKIAIGTVVIICGIIALFIFL